MIHHKAVIRLNNLSLLLLGFMLIFVAPPSFAERDTAARINQAVAFVTLGYGDLFDKPFRSLSFTTEELNTEETQNVLRLVKSYNAFEGEKVAQALNQFRGRISSYQFGREGSPVLYINLPYWTHQREGSNKGQRGSKIDDFEFRKIQNELRQIFVNTLHCDEFAIDEVRSRTIRVWWD